MNKERWRNCKSASRLLVKLAEETGEVANAYGNVLDAPNDDGRAHHMRQMRTELTHVQFIADVLEDLILASPIGGPIGARMEDADGA